VGEVVGTYMENHHYNRRCCVAVIRLIRSLLTMAKLEIDKFLDEHEKSRPNLVLIRGERSPNNGFLGVPQKGSDTGGIVDFPNKSD
jgi:hypothetical protein